MQIIEGKWVDSNEDPINHLNFNEFKKIKDSLSTMYDSNIDYDKINLMCFLMGKKGMEKKLCNIINDPEIIGKI
jgi:hypothetical protein